MCGNHDLSLGMSIKWLGNTTGPSKTNCLKDTRYKIVVVMIR